MGEHLSSGYPATTDNRAAGTHHFTLARQESGFRPVGDEYLHQATDILDRDTHLTDRVGRGNSIVLLLPDLSLEQMHLLSQPTGFLRERH